MTLFLLLLVNLIPLYVIIAAGYAGGRWLHFDRQTLANFALYFCVPIVMFGFAAQIDFKNQYILLPIITYGFQAAIAFSFLAIGKRIYGDSRANLLAMCTAMGNTGYFGLPVALVLFDAQVVAIYMFAALGFVLFEGTIGYYIAARGKFNVRDSFIKLAKFPSIYAVMAGLFINFSGAQLPDLFYTYWGYFKGAYVITGMMIIGAALSKIERLMIVPQFTMLAFAGKFIAWPMLVFLFAIFDAHVTQLFDPEIYQLMYLLSVVPFAANIAAFAAQMDLRAEKAATTILLGTIFALFYIPFVMKIVGH
jgi:predicted permease